MTPDEFVQCFRREKDDLLRTYLDASSGSGVATRIAELVGSPEQRSVMREIIDTALTDTFYRILLGLDGSALLGGVQQEYHIRDESGAVVCNGDGTIEVLAYASFHDDRNVAPDAAASGGGG
ncbi:MAG: hypothetical protein RLZZ326_4132 [Planctomycetota bacterium]|jgi:hypothetical protein